MPDVNHSDHPVDPGFDAPAAQGPGSHLQPDSGGVASAAQGPDGSEVGLSDQGNDFPSPRGPSGSHLENWNESDTVEPVATRAPTGSHLEPDLP